MNAIQLDTRLTSRTSHPSQPQVHWLCVGAGQLAIGHRPKLKALASIHASGATHLLTLLSESEGAKQVGNAARKASIQWLWLPLKNGDPPDDERLAEIMLMYQTLAQILSTGGRVFVHCSAGIHRTGMITNGLLRYLGHSEEEARATLATLRPITASEVGDDRLAWGRRFG